VEVEGLRQELQALGLALRFNLPVLTCDRLWAELTLPLRIQLLR
jgi:PIN domain nuclease of toxin-antitoxin system